MTVCASAHTPSLSRERPRGDLYRNRHTRPSPAADMDTVGRNTPAPFSGLRQSGAGLGHRLVHAMYACSESRAIVRPG